MITKVESFRKATIRYYFDNGNALSIIFGPYSYTDNYDNVLQPRSDESPISSTTVEIKPEGNKSFIRWMENEYDGVDVCGYVPVSELPYIMKRADSKAYKTK